MYINLTVNSKNKNSLKKFNYFFYSLCKIKNNIILSNQWSSKKNKKSFLLAKSPHVNKKSGERFGTTVYSLKIKLYSLDYLKMFIIFKYKSLNNFTDVGLNIKLFISKRNNIKLNTNNLNKYVLSNKNYLKLYDVFGENYFTV